MNTRPLTFHVLVLMLLPLVLVRPVDAEDAPVAAAPPHAEAIAALLAPIRAKHDIPGMTGAVLTSKGLVALGAVGVRRQGADAKVTPGDLWHIGSCTKSMTATLIGRLVDQGKLRWDTTLQEAFPDLGDAMDPGWRAVTLDQLLRNRAGAPHALDRDGLWSALWKHQGSAPDARRKLLLGVVKHPPEQAPESKFVYSNAGFAIAGHVAETVMKTPYEELIRRELFAPLGMTSVGFGAPGDPAKIDQPQGHRIVEGKRVPVAPGPGADNPVAISPAGRVHLSMRDWARYVALHLAAHRVGARLLLKHDTLRRIQEGKPDQPYAMGWAKTERPWGGGPVLNHNGSNTMWFAVAWLAPKKDFAVLVACNLGGAPGEKACDEAAGALIGWYAKQATTPR